MNITKKCHYLSKSNVCAYRHHIAAFHSLGNLQALRHLEASVVQFQLVHFPLLKYKSIAHYLFCFAENHRLELIDAPIH